MYLSALFLMVGITVILVYYMAYYTYTKPNPWRFIVAVLCGSFALMTILDMVRTASTCEGRITRIMSTLNRY
jgi:hypothetical protein